MSIYHPELLATPVPRYTSYPTAADFHDGVGPGDMAAALAAVGPDEPVSLYLHIPFCQEICWYCGCNTGASGRGNRLAAYLERLTAEIEMAAKQLGGRGRVTRIAVGGGSPNAVAPKDLAALLAIVRRAFGVEDAIISVEVDPRHLTEAWAGVLRDTGVTHASLGVQTLAPAIQTAIGRVQPLAVVERSVRLLRDAGITSLNFDLMYGLPGQRREDLAATLAQSIALQPDRLAVFGYAHVPHLIPRQRLIATDALPGAAERFEQAALAHAQLTAAGYQPIGFDHFALPGDPLAVAAREGRLHRNFQGFTDDDADVVIGMGVSAISQFSCVILQNHKHSGRYHLAVERGDFATNLGCRRSADDWLRGRIIEGILCNGVAETAALGDRSAFHKLETFEALGLLGWRGARLELAPDAMPYARSIAAAFDSCRSQSQVQLSRAV